MSYDVKVNSQSENGEESRERTVERERAVVKGERG